MWKNKCESLTLTGKRCKKNKKTGENFCTIHNPEYKKKPPEDCSICLEQITYKTSLKCNHSFCQDCIYKWLCSSEQLNCPFCRENITDIGLKHDAWNFGIKNKMLHPVSVKTFLTDSLTTEEYKSIQIEIDFYCNRSYTYEEFEVILNIFKDNEVFEKLLTVFINKTILYPYEENFIKCKELFCILN